MFTVVTRHEAGEPVGGRWEEFSVLLNRLRGTAERSVGGRCGAPSPKSALIRRASAAPSARIENPVECPPPHGASLRSTTVPITASGLQG